jgi:hypothetical protein
VPLSAVSHYSSSVAPLAVNHQGLFPAVTISFNLAPNVALGDAVDAIQATAREVGLPDTIQTFFAGTAQAYQDSLRNEPILIGAALLAGSAVPERDLRVRSEWRDRAAQRDQSLFVFGGSARSKSPGVVPGGDDFVQPRSGRGAGRRGGCH